MLYLHLKVQLDSGIDQVSKQAGCCRSNVGTHEAALLSWHPVACLLVTRAKRRTCTYGNTAEQMT